MSSKIYTQSQLLELEKYHRISLINEISGIRTPHLIGSRSKDGQENLALFNSVVHIGGNPPSLAFVMRPLTVERHTYANIKATGYYTMSAVHTDIVDQAHLTSAKYDEAVSEFEAVGLTPEYFSKFVAPHVKESHIKIGLKYQEEHLISFNKTIFVVGSIEYIEIAEIATTYEGNINHEKINTSGVSGLESYYTLQQFSKKGYARSNEKNIK